MSTKPLLLEGIVREERPDDGELRSLRLENRRLDEALRQVRNELGQALADKEQMTRSIRALRNQLTPLHRALRALFGEIELATGAEEIPEIGSASGTQGSQKWEAVKKTLAPRLAECVDLFLLQGSMKRTQIAAALKMDYSNCTRNVIGVLLRQGWLVEHGGQLSLKQL